MASILIYIILMLIVAALIVIASIIIYNRHLDKVTKGEAHDTHSSIPEPKTTAGVIYKTILMAVVILTFLNVSTLNGQVSGLQARINNLESDLSTIQSRLYDIQEGQREQDSRLESFEVNVGEADLDTNTVPVSVKAILKEYTDETEARLVLENGEYDLKNEGYGVFTCSVISGLFDECTDPKVVIFEPGRTYSEHVDYPSELFYEYFPIPGYETSFKSDIGLTGSMKYSGEYTVIIFGNPQNIEKATLTYVSNGQDLKSMDVTESVMNSERLTLEKGLDIKRDLTFRLEILTKDGYRIENQSLLMFEAIEYPDDYEYERIYGPDGTLLWDNDYK